MSIKKIQKYFWNIKRKSKKQNKILQKTGKICQWKFAVSIYMLLNYNFRTPVIYLKLQIICYIFVISH